MRALLAVVLVAACTHSYPITDAYELEGEHVTVETHSNESIEVVVEPAPDGVAFRSQTGYVSIADVARVVDKRRGRGALEGLGIGLLIGAAGGAIVGYADGDDECPPEGWCILTFTAGEKALLGGMFFGGVGGLVGGVIGLVRGSRVEYSYGERVRVIPNGPPGSTVGMTITF
jgi:hypothetical protein